MLTAIVDSMFGVRFSRVLYMNPGSWTCSARSRLWSRLTLRQMSRRDAQLGTEQIEWQSARRSQSRFNPEADCKQ